MGGRPSWRLFVGEDEEGNLSDSDSEKQAKGSKKIQLYVFGSLTEKTASFRGIYSSFVKASEHKKTVLHCVVVLLIQAPAGMMLYSTLLTCFQL